jgi:hypothetical protein
MESNSYNDQYKLNFIVKITSLYSYLELSSFTDLVSKAISGWPLNEYSMDSLKKSKMIK